MRDCYIQPPKKPYVQSAGVGGVFPYLLCCAKSDLKIKIKFRSPAIP